MAEPTEWRLSGGIGTADPSTGDAQVMLQGLGFPLRTVDGAPPQGTGDIFNPESVAEGLFMQFMSQGWEQGKLYVEGAVVTNGIWTMVANQATFQQPYPSPVGSPTFTIPAFAPSTQSDASVITSGHQWTLTEDTLITTIRVWVPSISATTFYKVTFSVLLPGAPNPIVATIDDPLLTAGEFTIVSQQPELIPSGAVITAILQAIETAGGNTVVGTWQRVGDGVVAPGAGNWRTDVGRNQLRVSILDVNSLDRTSDLETIGINTTVSIIEASDPLRSLDLTVTGPGVDETVNFLYPVVKTAEGVNGEPRNNQNTSMTYEVPTVLTTEYSEELAGLADTAWATVVPILQFDGVDQSPLADTAFGVDMQGDITTFSDEWTVFSFAG